MWVTTLDIDKFDKDKSREAFISLVGNDGPNATNELKVLQQNILNMRKGMTNEDEAAIELCRRCGIESRTELHGNKVAQIIYDGLVKEFEKEIDDF